MLHLNPMRGHKENWEMPIASLQERLEAMCPGNGRGNNSREEETHSPAGGDIMNLLLLGLLQK